MKKIFSILLILVSNLTFGQTEFSIRINADVAVDSVSVSSLNLSKKFTSAFQYGIATIKIPVNYSDQYLIFVKGKRIDAWFNAGKIDIYLEFINNELSISKTTNSPIYERKVSYFNKYTEFLNDNSIGTDYIKNAIIENDQDAFVLVPLSDYLELYQNDIAKLNFIRDVMNKQPISTKQHIIFSMISRRLESLKSTKQINLKKYSLVGTNGENSIIESNPNMDYTVLDFWFTTCSPCIKEHNEILADPDMFKDLNAELIGISTDSEQEKWLNYLDSKKVNWKNYRVAQSDLKKDLGIWSFPTYIILDKENNVLGSYSNISTTIEALKK